MNKLLLFVLLWGIAETVCGQQANFRQAEKFRKVGSEIGSLKVTPHFLEGSNKFWYNYKTSNGTCWIRSVGARNCYLIIIIWLRN